MKTLAKARLLVTRFPFESQLGGEEVHTISLMKALDKRGYEAFFLGSCPVLAKLFGKAGFEVKKAWLGKPPVNFKWLVLFTILSPVLFLRAGWLLWKARKSWRVEVLYCLSLGEKLLMTPWARFFGMKVLWLEHARIGDWMSRNPWRWVYKFLSRWAVVVVTSNRMRGYAEKFAKHVEAISCGVVVSEKMEDLPANVSKFLKGGFALGCVARLTVDKGVDVVTRLVHSKPDMRLILVGSGPLKKRVEKLGGEQVLVLDSMPRKQLMSLYKSLDLFVLGSTKMDPFGMVAAEAMWFGTPVLMTEECGIAADLENGREAVIVEAKFASMDKAVKKLMKHVEMRREIGRRGQAFVKSHYRLSKKVDEFEKLL